MNDFTCLMPAVQLSHRHQLSGGDCSDDFEEFVQHCSQLYMYWSSAKYIQHVTYLDVTCIYSAIRIHIADTTFLWPFTFTQIRG